MQEKTSLKIKTTHQFEKDYKLCKKQGKNIKKLKFVVNLLKCRETIPEKYKDHKLENSKEFASCRELHIEPDWLLVYRITETELILTLVRTGSHSHVF